MFLSKLDIAIIQTILKESVIASPIKVTGVLDAFTVKEYEIWALCNLPHTQSLAFPNRAEGIPDQFIQLLPNIDIKELLEKYSE